MSGAVLTGESQWPSRANHTPGILVRVLFAVVFTVVFGWLIVALVTPRFALVLLDTGGIYTVQWFVGSILLTMAFTLFGFAYASQQPRLRWLALGLVVHALGNMFFGDVLPRMTGGVDLETGLYGLLLTRGCMIGLTATGLLLSRPPKLTIGRATVITGAYLALLAFVPVVANALPPLVAFEAIPALPVTGPTPGFTWFYWLVSAVIILLAWATMFRVVLAYSGWRLNSWVVVVTVILAAAMTHTAFRPSLFGFSTELTSANVLMTLLGLLIVIGSMFSLRTIADTIAAERDALAIETRRLADLERLRSDFTTMVAHELAQPLVAIRRTAESMQLLDPASLEQRQAFATIAAEASTLFTLIDDVYASATTRSEDFSLDIVPVDLGAVLDRAQVFAAALPGSHPPQVEEGVDGDVWADPIRIEQVLKNLLDNAVRYTPPGTPITLRSVRVAGSIARIEVEDEGPGIEPDQLQRVFGKYERGTSGESGLGVGLYLSRRILRGCGSDLHYRRGASGGSCFWFDLPRVSG